MFPFVSIRNNNSKIDQKKISLFVLFLMSEVILVSLRCVQKLTVSDTIEIQIETRDDVQNEIIESFKSTNIRPVKRRYFVEDGKTMLIRLNELGNQGALNSFNEHVTLGEAYIAPSKNKDITEGLIIFPTSKAKRDNAKLVTTGVEYHLKYAIKR